MKLIRELLNKITVPDNELDKLMNPEGYDNDAEHVEEPTYWDVP